MTLRVFLIPFLCANLGFAQSDPWDRVKLIDKGKNVAVKLASGKSLNGKMEQWSPDSIVLRSGGQTVEVAKGDARRVYLKSGMTRGRRAAWAAGIGAGAGAALYGAIAASDSFDADIAPAALVAGGAAFIGGIAAGIAALIPQHQELIYTAEPIAGRRAP